jgi:hypothetical protein
MNEANGTWSSPKILYRNELFFFVSVFMLRDSRLGDVVLLCEKSGKFVVLFGENLESVSVVEIAGMSRIVHANEVNLLDAISSFFYCSDAESNSFVFRMDLTDGLEDVTIEFSLIARLQIPCARGVIWSLSMITLIGPEENYCFFAGDHDGNLVVFQMPGIGEETEENENGESLAKKIDFPCSSLYAHLHGKERVAALRLYRDEANDGKVMLVSCGRNGKLLFFEVGTTSGMQYPLIVLYSNFSGIMLKKTREVKSYKNMEMLVNCLLLGKDICYSGFFGTNFIVYNLSANSEILSVPCGGSKSMTLV